MIHPNLVAIDATLPRVRSRKVAAFLTYMRRIHPADRLPGRRDIDPLHIPDLLGHVVLVEVRRQPAPAPARFFVRVAGEVMLAAAPAPMMNRYLDEFSRLAEPHRTDRSTDIIADVRQEVLATGRLYYWRGKPRMKFRLDYDDVEYVHCPLADDGVTIDRIFSALYYSGSE